MKHWEWHWGKAWDRGYGQPMSRRKGDAEATAGHCLLKLERLLKFLSPREISVIDDLLASGSPFGAVRPAV